MGVITRLAHINILAHDLAAAEQFYCGVLGMERGFDFIKNGELYGFYEQARANGESADGFVLGGRIGVSEGFGLTLSYTSGDDFDGFSGGIRVTW